MCELIIKRSSSHHSDPEKDRRGCYKRGDIIGVRADGATANMPHLTVILIPGLVLSDEIVQWIGSPRYEAMTHRRRMKRSTYLELQEADYEEQSQDFDGGGPRTFGQQRRTQAPTLEEVLDDTVADPIYEVEESMIDMHTRRLFQIPADKMDELFPAGTTRVELTIPQARQLARDVINKREA